MWVRVVGVAFLFHGRERANATCVVVTTLMRIKLRIDCFPVSFPARVVVQKPLYRFVGTCERGMWVRVVGVAFLFPGWDRANGTCVVVTTLMPTHKIKDCLFSSIFPHRGWLCKNLSIDLLALVSEACR